MRVGAARKSCRARRKSPPHPRDCRRIEPSIRHGLYAGSPARRQVSYAPRACEKRRLQGAVAPRVRHQYSEKLMRVFVTGGTGYIGSRLVPALIRRGHRVSALVRAGSERKISAHCDVVVGNPFDRSTFAHAIAAGDTVVQLVGVPPSLAVKGAAIPRYRSRGRHSRRPPRRRPPTRVTSSSERRAACACDTGGLHRPRAAEPKTRSRRQA